MSRAEAHETRGDDGARASRAIDPRCPSDNAPLS